MSGLRTTAQVLCLAVLVSCLPPSRSAQAGHPDPPIAVLISTAATLIPLGVTTGLWLGERGTDEGIRFDVGLLFMAIGAILGPSTGQIYASGGGDAWASFWFRALTGSLMTAGFGLRIRGKSSGIQTAGQAMAILAGIPTVLLAAYDIIDSGSSAIETQRASGHAERASIEPAPGTPLGLAPTAGLALPLPTHPGSVRIDPGEALRRLIAAQVSAAITASADGPAATPEGGAAGTAAASIASAPR